MSKSKVEKFLDKYSFLDKSIKKSLIQYEELDSRIHLHLLMTEVYQSKLLKRKSLEVLNVLLNDWFKLIQPRHSNEALILIQSILEKKKYPFKKPFALQMSELTRKEKGKKKSFVEGETSKLKKKKEMRNFKEPLAKIIYVPQGGKKR